MELIFELFLELFGELIFSGLLGLLDTSGQNTTGARLRRALAYAVLGAVTGMVSIVAFPAHVLHAPEVRLVWLAIAPVVGGLGFSATKQLAGRRTGLLLLHGWPFAYGALLLGTLNVVRFVAAR